VGGFRWSKTSTNSNNYNKTVGESKEPGKEWAYIYVFVGKGFVTLKGRKENKFERYNILFLEHVHFVV